MKIKDAEITFTTDRAMQLNAIVYKDDLTAIHEWVLSYPKDSVEMSAVLVAADFFDVHVLIKPYAVIVEAEGKYQKTKRSWLAKGSKPQ